MTEFEEIFSRPWSCKRMACSWTIKTKSNGALLGRGNEHKCPLWRVQIVPFFMTVDSTLRKKNGWPLFFICIFVCSYFSLLGSYLSYFCFCPSNSLFTFFSSCLFQLYMRADGTKHHLWPFIFHLFPCLTLHFSLSFSWHIHLRCYLANQQNKKFIGIPAMLIYQISMSIQTIRVPHKLMNIFSHCEWHEATKNT